MVFNRQEAFLIVAIHCNTNHDRTLSHLSQFVIWQSLTQFFRILKHSGVGIRNASNSNTPAAGNPNKLQKRNKYHLFQGCYSLLVAGVCKVDNLQQAK